MKDPNRKSRPPVRPNAKRARSQLIPGRVRDESGLAPRPLLARVAAWYANAGPVWRFGLKFGALMALYYVLVLTPWCDRLFYAYLGANAWLANGVLNWLGQDSHVTEITIRSARFAITVRRGCDAIEPTWFFCAALISFPAPAMRKALGVVVGAVLLQTLNLVRIVSLYFVGLHYPGSFNTAHVEIWPATFIIVAIALWAGWIGWTRRPARPASHAVV